MSREGERYAITEKGRRNSEICESSLPYSVRRRCDDNLVRVNETLMREQQVQGEVLPNPDGTCTVRLRLADDSGPLLELSLLGSAIAAKRGAHLGLTLVTERAENVMLVPVDAIYYSGGKGYVYLYEDGKAKMASVEVGLYDSENAQILSGLNADDMVVSTWSSNLYEGADIRLKSDAEAADAAGDGQGAGGQTPAGDAQGAGGQAPAGDAQGAGGQAPSDDAQDADSKAPQGAPAAGGAQNGNAAPKAQ